MTFIATVYKISVDREGEATVVLKVPLTDMNAVLPFAGKEETLKVTFEAEEK